MLDKNVDVAILTMKVVYERCKVRFLLGVFRAFLIVLWSWWYSHLLFVYPLMSVASASCFHLSGCKPTIRTSGSNNWGCALVFSATIFAIAEPQLPDPTTVTRCRFSWAPSVAIVRRSREVRWLYRFDGTSLGSVENLRRESLEMSEEAMLTGLGITMGCDNFCISRHLLPELNV